MKIFRGRKATAPAAAAAFALGLAAFGAAALPAAAQDAKNSAPAGNAENGQKLFVKNGCYECHGREGQGSSMTGPRIAPNPPSFEYVSSYIRAPKGEMPPYSAKVLPDKDVADIYAFLQSRKEPPKTSPLLK